MTLGDARKTKRWNFNASKCDIIYVQKDKKEKSSLTEWATTLKEIPYQEVYL